MADMPGRWTRESATQDDIVRLMIGRSLDQYFPQHLSAQPGKVALSVRGLWSPGRFANVSFDLRAGEILGLGGLVGSGRSEVANAIFGLDRMRQGRDRAEPHADEAWIGPRSNATRVRAGSGRSKTPGTGAEHVRPAEHVDGDARPAEAAADAGLSPRARGDGALFRTIAGENAVDADASRSAWRESTEDRAVPSGWRGVQGADRR